MGGGVGKGLVFVFHRSELEFRFQRHSHPHCVASGVQQDANPNPNPNKANTIIEQHHSDAYSDAVAATDSDRTYNNSTLSNILHSLVLRRSRTSGVCICREMIYFKELAHTVMDTGKSKICRVSHRLESQGGADAAVQV